MSNEITFGMTTKDKWLAVYYGCCGLIMAVSFYVMVWVVADTWIEGLFN